MRNIKKNPFNVHFFTNSFIDLDENQYVAATCWFVDAHAIYIFGGGGGGKGGGGGSIKFKRDNSADTLHRWPCVRRPP